MDDVHPCVHGLAQLIHEADFLLIAAGAGFSADSGLPVYADIATVPAYTALDLAYGNPICVEM